MASRFTILVFAVSALVVLTSGVTALPPQLPTKQAPRSLGADCGQVNNAPDYLCETTAMCKTCLAKGNSQLAAFNPKSSKVCEAVQTAKEDIKICALICPRRRVLGQALGRLIKQMKHFVDEEEVCGDDGAEALEDEFDTIALEADIDLGKWWSNFENDGEDWWLIGGGLLLIGGVGYGVRRRRRRLMQARLAACSPDDNYREMPETMEMEKMKMEEVSQV